MTMSVVMREARCVCAFCRHPSSRRHILEGSANEAGDTDTCEFLFSFDIFSTLDGKTLGHGDTGEEDDERYSEGIEDDGSESPAVDEVVIEAVPTHNRRWESTRYSASEFKSLGAEDVADDASKDTHDERSEAA